MNSHARDESRHTDTPVWIPSSLFRLDATGSDRQWSATPSPLVETARITCNTYSVPYKGKDPKKRLSPKSPNTLIHSCITFYKTLIFQYLSLWKSVFSPD